MRNKNDIALAATSARRYNRHWRANKLSWTEIGKIKYLFDGAIEYMDEVTLAYTQVHFNHLRKALGFKQDSELAELVERSEAFRVVRNKKTKQMEAFMSPLVGDRFVPTMNQEIVEPAFQYELFECKANALANNNDRDKISENQRQHKNGINMKILLAGNVPKFHAKPKDEAHCRIHTILIGILNNPELCEKFFGEFIYHYKRKYSVDYYLARNVLELFINEYLTRHMASRVGIENWENEAITKWLKFYFGAKKLPYVITLAKEVHDNFIEKQSKQGHAS